MKIDFIGIGAQKAGTSWIYACLQEHPQICCPVKEIHFFSRKKNWDLGFGWYEKHFSSCPESSVKGEFSTSYLFSQAAAGRIAEKNPDVKLIVCLRNPVERAFSNYLHDLRNGRIPAETKFNIAVKGHPEYLEQGFYASQLKRYFNYFNKDQLKILLFDNIKKDPKRFIESIYRFLDVDPGFVPEHLYKKVNVGVVPIIPGIDKSMNRIANLMRNHGLGNIIWKIKNTGLINKLEEMGIELLVPPQPQFVNALGAAIMAEERVR